MPIASASAASSTAALTAATVVFLLLLTNDTLPKSQPGSASRRLQGSSPIQRYDDQNPRSIRASSVVQSKAGDISSFWWRDIDYTQKVNCGGRKCFFHSASNPSSAGYLVQATAGPCILEQNKWPAPFYGGTDLLDKYQLTYKYAHALESEHGIRHLLSSPPFEMDIPADFTEELISTYLTLHPPVEEEAGLSGPEQFLGATSLVVQPSHTHTGRVIKCTHGTKYFTSFVSQGYQGTLFRELTGMISLVKDHPELSKDFQLLVDSQGQIYQIDLDRVIPNQLPEGHASWKEWWKVPEKLIVPIRAGSEFDPKWIESCLERAISLSFWVHRCAQYVGM